MPITKTLSTCFRRGANVQRVRPFVPHAPPAGRPPTEEATLRLQRVRQPVPVADGPGAPQGGVPALVGLVVLLAVRLGVRARSARSAPPALMPPPHCCRGQAR